MWPGVTAAHLYAGQSAHHPGFEQQSTNGVFSAFEIAVITISSDGAGTLISRLISWSPAADGQPSVTARLAGCLTARARRRAVAGPTRAVVIWR